MENILGLIKLRIKRGTNLKPCDSDSSDPYVLVTLEETKLKTRHEKDSLNPEWNEELTLYIKDVNIPIHLTVCDKDTFTKDDKMGEADIDLKPYLLCVKVGLSELPEGHVVKRIEPNDSNCLAEESKIIWTNGKVIQYMTLKLRNVNTGELHVEIEWLDVPESKGLSGVPL
ncbi:protein C2-DOMAIN ABA-RELATED 7 [Arachis duranensis]|uniref:Protein C2-DOMAIN ABA-RELATED 7 n=1 Tax=Arachis duranensis TaxID=130453 RepID=A0A6P4D2E0_ARADU|nr:protein C2-DOMAIN ABA-RELATED 7 [Arachis duranensis]XP_025695069.1 protein C2-DOMAIN ABA-RELATED 7 [Arachis hypogaea]XP_057757055.1 protein C2-DOMAIN ABA-RELATED 7-like isoform X1 [Arachis stenosperma]